MQKSITSQTVDFGIYIVCTAKLLFTEANNWILTTISNGEIIFQQIFQILCTR